VLYAQDVFTKTHGAAAVLRPASAEELEKSVRIASKAGLELIPRGGGMSYSSGYVPQNEGSLIIDLGRMTKVLEVNTVDMYITVEAGCTWEAVYKALENTGYRTPFWGPLSGRFATVGGSVSQNAMFWGSCKYGSAADSVVSLSVVLANGETIQTGSAAQKQASPWFRHYGPDLSGIFIGDCGALGFKATVTLKLIKEQKVRTGLSFSAENADDLLNFAAEVSRNEFASEIFGFDPYLQAQRLKRESLGKDVKALAGVLKSAGSIGKAIKSGAKIAMAGRGYMKDVKFSLHTLLEESYDEVVKHKQKAIRELAQKFGLNEIENSIPTILRANPFGPVNAMIGPEAQRWAPIHAVVPHSKNTLVYNAIETLFEQNKESIEKFDIGCGYLFTIIANNCSLIEPVFFWPDELNELHRHAVEDSHLKTLSEFPANPEAREFVIGLRKQLSNIFAEFGCVHVQIGKTYKYREHLDPRALQLVDAIKNNVDPNLNINPGSLGFQKA